MEDARAARPMRMKMNEQMTYPGLNWKARGAGAVRYRQLLILIRSCFEYPSHKIVTNLQVLALVLQGDEVPETDGREGDECVIERVDQRPAFLQSRKWNLRRVIASDSEVEV